MDIYGYEQLAVEVISRGRVPICPIVNQIWG